MNTTVGIVEDDALLRSALARIVGEARGFRCLAACASGEEALQKLPAGASGYMLKRAELEEVLEAIKDAQPNRPSCGALVP